MSPSHDETFRAFWNEVHAHPQYSGLQTGVVLAFAEGVIRLSRAPSALAEHHQENLRECKMPAALRCMPIPGTISTLCYGSPFVTQSIARTIEPVVWECVLSGFWSRVQERSEFAKQAFSELCRELISAGVSPACTNSRLRDLVRRLSSHIIVPPILVELCGEFGPAELQHVARGLTPILNTLLHRPDNRLAAPEPAIAGSPEARTSSKPPRRTDSRPDLQI